MWGRKAENQGQIRSGQIEIGLSPREAMKPMSEAQFEQARGAAKALNAAMSPLGILKSVAWPDEERRRFLSSGRLPKPIYEEIDMSASRDAAKAARESLDGEHVVFDWLRREIETVETTAQMLAARGTADFSRHSQTLYGHPSKLLLDGKTQVINLARHMDGTLADLDIPKLVIEGYETFMDAPAFVNAFQPLLKEHFGSKAPKVIISEDLAAKAVASSKRIRIRAEAQFSSRDIDQLLQHEALIHVATALNGRAQKYFPILGRAHAGSTEIQEGLAVFAEMISGAMDPVRFRRLADRVIAIQMSLDGADFKEVFDFYAERTERPEDAFENTRRVFRGGVISGGAPFTKDMVYLNGLLRVHNFMRTAVSLGRADLIRLLFVGKMDLEDIPALAQLASSGRVSMPKYMPPWVKDLRFLVSYLAYSSFLNQVKMPGFKAYYEEALADVPVVWDIP